MSVAGRLDERCIVSDAFLGLYARLPVPVDRKALVKEEANDFDAAAACNNNEGSTYNARCSDSPDSRAV